MKKFLLGLLVGFVISVLAGIILLFAMIRVGQRPPHIPDDAILTLRVEGDIPELPAMEFPVPFLSEKPTLTVKDHWEMLRMAARDQRIRGVVLIPAGINAGWAKIEELRSSLLRYKESGKPLYAFLRGAGAREYYLATAADRIYITPEDYLDLKGLRVEMIFIHQTLNKLGVQVEIATAGRYKSAPEMFTRDSASPENREVMNSILDERFTDLVNTIATGRKQSPEQVRKIVDEGPFLAPEAQARGLVDGLLYEDQVFGEMQRGLDLDEIRKVTVNNYRRISPASLGLEGRHRVALLIAQGEIIRGRNGIFGEENFIRSEDFIRLLRQVGEDRNIRGVILRIDSPGGDALASDEIWREIILLRGKKPIIFSMSDSAASGGYYIAATGDPIVAYPGTLTGSIGVFYGKVNLREFYNKLGIRKEILQRGRFASIDSEYVPLSPEGRKKLQASIDAFYRGFVERVAEARKQPFEKIEPLAQGRVWLGSQAQRNGLIDELGGLNRAIEMLKDKAGIPVEESVSLITYPPRRSILERLFSPPTEAMLNSRIETFLRQTGTVFWPRNGILKLMPYTIQIN